MKFLYFFCFLILIFFSKNLSAQSPIGVWVTIDDESGKEKSHVEIYEKEGKLFGKIVKLLLKPQNTLCTVCDGIRKNKPLIGMIIISNMKKNGGKWSEGIIYKADVGKEYSGYLEMIDSDHLKVTGKVLFISKSQIWRRLN